MIYCNAATHDIKPWDVRGSHGKVAGQCQTLRQAGWRRDLTMGTIQPRQHAAEEPRGLARLVAARDGPDSALAARLPWHGRHRRAAPAPMLQDRRTESGARGRACPRSDQRRACWPRCACSMLAPCSSSPRPMPPRSVPLSTRRASCRPSSSCGGGSRGSPTTRRRGPASGPSPAGSRRPQRRVR